MTAPLDPQAATRWQHAAPPASPWLHEEVASRMAERLEWITLKPKHWLHWWPVRGGMQAHQRIAAHYASARAYLHEEPAHLPAAKALLSPIWSPARWQGAGTLPTRPQDQTVDMLWANLNLHLNPEPQALIAQWHAALADNGFLMFSALGPDTLRELRALYASLGWPAPSQAFTDMHDWGDMLLAQGFAEPVMDMETITLTFATPQRALQELRELGRNLNPERFATLRGKAWKQTLLSAMQTQLSAGPERSISLSFEIIYGHAIKPQLSQQHQLARAKADPALGGAHIPLAQVKKALSEQRKRPDAKN